MNSAIAIDPRAAIGVCHREPEKVSVRHIRLVLPRQGCSAKVGTFFAADKVLLSWAMRAQETFACEFEIVYDDGHTLAGEYCFQRKAASRPALMAFIRKTISLLCEGSGQESAVHGLGDCPHSFLARYETDDFTSY